METHLKSGTRLQNGRYEIGSVIGQGGFGITYRATAKTIISGALGSHDAKITIAVKEFFFADYCTRDADGRTVLTTATQSGSEMFERFRRKLIKEAHLLSSLRHPNIVSVIDIFEENGTAYMVMEYVEGRSLADIIKAEGALAPDRAVKYAAQICYAVDNIHRHNILHLDIKPGNILIDSEDNVKVIDFGISKQYDRGHVQTSTTPVGVSRGFAPIEQYSDVSHFAPQTDIYAIGATIYYMLTGNVPVESLLRMTTALPPLPASVPAHVGQAVERAMSLAATDRQQSAAELSAALNAEPIDGHIHSNPAPTAKNTVVNAKTTVSTSNSEPKRSKTQKGIGVLSVIFAIAIVFILIVILSRASCSSKENDKFAISDTIPNFEADTIPSAKLYDNAQYYEWINHCEHEAVATTASRAELDLGNLGEMKTWHCEILNYPVNYDEAEVPAEYEPNCYLKLWFEDGSMMRGELTRGDLSFDLLGGYDGQRIKLFSQNPDIRFYLDIEVRSGWRYYWSGYLTVTKSSSIHYRWEEGKSYYFEYDPD